MHRPTIGIISFTLLAAGLVLAVLPLHDASVQPLRSACLRIGLVMSAWWLAFEELQRIPRWLVWTVPLVVLAAAASRKFLPVVAILLVLLFLLKLGTGQKKSRA